MTTTRLLLVDDEQEVIDALSRVFRKLDLIIFSANSGQEGLDILANECIDIVISDFRMPNMDGNQFLRKVATNYPEIIRMMLTAHTEIEQVITAINQGKIWGFMQKPWNNRELLIAIEQAIQHKSMMAERSMLKQVVNRYQQYHKTKFEGFIGDSIAMQFVYQAIEQAAPSSASIFVTGESGTGKEVAAEAIHHLSKRQNAPFIALNCAAIPSDLMESEIFGHVKGAFSGAISHRDGAAKMADGGTLFLDELGEMDINLQAKLLRFIQTGEFQKVGSSQTEQVDIRFISATNRSPLEAIAQGKLREDLYYRLNVISIDLPALAERESDAIQLAHHFLNIYNQKEQRDIVGFSKEAESFITKFAWPGNVRQLQNVIHSAVVLSPGSLINADVLKAQVKDIGRATSKVRTPSQMTATQFDSGTTPESASAEIIPLASMEKLAIENAIKQCNDNVVQAASLLGVSPSTLYRKMQQWQS